MLNWQRVPNGTKIILATKIQSLSSPEIRNYTKHIKSWRIMKWQKPWVWQSHASFDGHSSLLGFLKWPMILLWNMEFVRICHSKQPIQAQENTTGAIYSSKIGLKFPLPKFISPNNEEDRDALPDKQRTNARCRQQPESDLVQGAAALYQKARNESSNWLV